MCQYNLQAKQWSFFWRRFLGFWRRLEENFGGMWTEVEGGFRISDYISDYSTAAVLDIIYLCGTLITVLYAYLPLSLSLVDKGTWKEK